MATKIFVTLTVSLALAGALTAGELKTGSSKSLSAASYNIPLWEPGKVPLAKGDGPLDTPFLTVFLPAECEAQRRFGGDRARRFQHHADVWGGRNRYRGTLQRLGRDGVCAHLPAGAAVWGRCPGAGRQARYCRWCGRMRRR